MKKLLFILITLFTCLSINNVYAGGGYDYTDDVDDFTYIDELEAGINLRLSYENYGVNKKININSNNISNIKKTPLVDASLKVYDFSSVLTDYEINDLKKKSLEFKNKTGIDLVIVTIDKEYSDYEIEEFSDDFMDYNDFGIDETKTSYDVILAIRNTNDYNRYYYVSTGGIAQIYYPSNRLDNILDDMYNNMHNDNYYEGFKDFISSALENYEKGIPSKYEGCYVDYNGDLFDKDGNKINFDKGIYRVPYILAFIISLITSIIVLVILISKNRMIKKAVNANDYIDTNSLNYTKKEDNFISTHTSSYRINTNSGSGGSHHSSSGFSHGGGGRHC